METTTMARVRPRGLHLGWCQPRLSVLAAPQRRCGSRGLRLLAPARVESADQGMCVVRRSAARVDEPVIDGEQSEYVRVTVRDHLLARQKAASTEIAAVIGDSTSIRRRRRGNSDRDVREIRADGPVERRSLTPIRRDGVVQERMSRQLGQLIATVVLERQIDDHAERPREPRARPPDRSGSRARAAGCVAGMRLDAQRSGTVSQRAAIAWPLDRRAARGQGE